MRDRFHKIEILVLKKLRTLESVERSDTHTGPSKILVDSQLGCPPHQAHRLLAAPPTIEFERSPAV